MDDFLRILAGHRRLIQLLRQLVLCLDGTDGQQRAHHRGNHQQQRNRRRHAQRLAMPPHKFPQTITRPRRRGAHRLVRKVMLDVQSEGIGRLVAARPVLLDGLHHHPVQVLIHQPGDAFRHDVPGAGNRRALFRRDDAQAGRGLRRVHLADDAQHFLITRRRQRLRVKRRAARE